MKRFKYLNRYDLAEISLILGVFVIALGMVFCLMIAASSTAAQGCIRR